MKLSEVKAKTKSRKALKILSDFSNSKEVCFLVAQIHRSLQIV